MPSNTGPLRVLEKCGFHKEGLAKQNVRINGKWEDHIILAIINEKKTNQVKEEEVRVTACSKMMEYMGGLSTNGYFNGAVSVWRKGEIVFSTGCGKASFQYGIDHTSSTKFLIGSLTKAFTAMLVLILHEQERVDLESRIVDIMPDFPHHDVTVHHLLSHSSGIPNFTSQPQYWDKTMRLPASLNDVISSFLELPLSFQPGEKMDYSNSNYILLTAIIEKLSGQSYSQCLKSEILEKLGMEQTGVSDGRTIIEQLASGHTVWETVKNAEFIDMSFPTGAYGMYSSAADLCKWAEALIHSTLISPGLQKRMFQSTNGVYGYGWFVDEQRKEAGHFGDINGFVNQILLYPEEEAAVVVLSNMNITPVTRIARDLAELMRGGDAAASGRFTAAGLLCPELTGTYSDGRKDISIEGENQLFATVPKYYGVPSKFPLVPVSIKEEEVVCKSRYINDTYTFHFNYEGDVSLTLEEGNGDISTYVRIRKIRGCPERKTEFLDTSVF
ncbi:serine hydrolase [Peribacillus kribbensis]|uniref:serine hydrolase n=1 Tax=Peribacillus kribbensis TaxID=356658 RepID=UPI001C58BE7A|nr:serine hydrolase [Peribacillus kribbensis]